MYEYLKKVRHWLVRSGLLLHFGNNIKIGRNLCVRKHFNVLIRRGGRCIIGNDCSFNNDCSINALGLIEIGNDVIFGENVKMYDHNHSFNVMSISIREQNIKIGKIRIKDNCWIGSNVVILKDVEIGSGSIIGAGCVLKESIPPNSIVTVGNNLNIIKRRDNNL